MKFQFLFGLVSRSLFAPIFQSKFWRLGLLKLGFRKEVIAKQKFTDINFMDFGVGLCRFSEAVAAVFLIFAVLETGLEIHRISARNRIQRRWGGGGSLSPFWRRESNDC